MATKMLISDVLALLMLIMDCGGAKQTNTSYYTVTVIKGIEANTRYIDTYSSIVVAVADMVGV